jgi:hypothetical protein
MAPTPILRVQQLDAALLDSQVVSTVSEQVLVDAFKYFDKTSLRDRFEPEWTTLVHLLVAHMTLYSPTGNTYGNIMQNIAYRPLSLRLKTAHAAMTLGGVWAWHRMTRYMTSEQWSNHASVHYPYISCDGRRRGGIARGQHRIDWNRHSKPLP